MIDPLPLSGDVMSKSTADEPEKPDVKLHLEKMISIMEFCTNEPRVSK
jgi:hypothetical protein